MEIKLSMGEETLVQHIQSSASPPEGLNGHPNTLRNGFHHATQIFLRAATDFECLLSSPFSTDDANHPWLDFKELCQVRLQFHIGFAVNSPLGHFDSEHTA